MATDDEWQRLCDVAGHPEWGQEARFTMLADRLRHADALDVIIETWTQTQDAEDVMRRLQGVGIAAGVVQNMRQLR